jgi:hypothetical protein
MIIMHTIQDTTPCQVRDGGLATEAAHGVLKEKEGINVQFRSSATQHYKAWFNDRPICVEIHTSPISKQHL